jgi:hypothetical protein
VTVNLAIDRMSLELLPALSSTGPGSSGAAVRPALHRAGRSGGRISASPLWNFFGIEFRRLWRTHVGSRRKNAVSASIQRLLRVSEIRLKRFNPVRKCDGSQIPLFPPFSNFSKGDSSL